MENKINNKIDLHIHSTKSACGYSTLNEILNYSNKQKMDLISLTDHGPFVKNQRADMAPFMMFDRAPRLINNTKILYGCESNFLDDEGNIGLDQDIIDGLDILLLGYHGNRDKGYANVTNAMITAIEKNPVTIITHPTYSKNPFDVEQVIDYCLEKKILLELNNSKVKKDAKRGKLDPHKMMIKKVRDAGQKVIVNSDAHFLHEIGDFNAIIKYWDELNLSEDLIINNYPKELCQKIGIFS